jgi:hypothetical protein
MEDGGGGGGAPTPRCLSHAPAPHPLARWPTHSTPAPPPVTTLRSGVQQTAAARSMSGGGGGGWHSHMQPSPQTPMYSHAHSIYDTTPHGTATGAVLHRSPVDDLLSGGGDAEGVVEGASQPLSAAAVAAAVAKDELVHAMLHHPRTEQFAAQRIREVGAAEPAPNHTRQRCRLRGLADGGRNGMARRLTHVAMCGAPCRSKTT